MRSPIPLLTFAILLAAASACNTSGCPDNGSSLPLAGLYSSASGEQVGFDSIAVGGVGAPGDSLLVAPGTACTEVYLPLRSDRTSASFFFHYDYEGIDSVIFNDTIEFHYSSFPFFASEECGAMFRYHIERVNHTRHLIDSVVVTDSLITNANIERIKIYFRQ